MLAFTGKSGLSETTEIHVRNNTIVFNHLDGGANCIICQPEYFNRFFISINYFYLSGKLDKERELALICIFGVL